MDGGGPGLTGDARSQPLLTGPFVTCATVLAAAAVGMTAAKEYGWLQLVKKPVELREPLEQLPPDALAPLRLKLLPRLDSEAEQELGTAQYAFWRVEDPRVGADKPWRTADLAITYYTGVPDQVPHVAEECIYQGGGQQVEQPAEEMVEIPAGPGFAARSIPIRQVLFRDMSSPAGFRVFYTFGVNGDFYGNREAVRNRMVDFREKYLYYSKIELSFRVDTQNEPTAAVREAAYAVFRKLVPVVGGRFWPDWDEVMRRQQSELR